MGVPFITVHGFSETSGANGAIQLSPHGFTSTGAGAPVPAPAGLYNVFVGSSAPSAIRVGSNKVSAVYVGSTLVWSDNVSPSPPPPPPPPPPPAGTTYSFFASSAPAGITTTTGASPYQYQWSLTEGLQTAGDATGHVFTVQPTASLSGNYLIQASYKYNQTDNCPDGAIAIWDANNSRTSSLWAWTSNASRIQINTDCATGLFIFGTASTTVGTGQNTNFGSFTAGAYYTIHVWVNSTAGSVTARLTLGQDDWTNTGSQINGNVTLSQAIPASYYVGVGSDSDGYAIGTKSVNFSGLRTLAF